MRFGFSEDQELFRETVAEMLEKECPHEALAGAWETDDGFVPGLWAKLAEMGVLGISVPEEYGGLGMDEVDGVLLFQEAGRFAIPEPLVEVVAVAAPLLADVGGPVAEEWLPKIAAGEARVAVRFDPDPYVANAASADLLLLQRGDELHAVAPGEARFLAQKSVDGVRRLYGVEFDASDATRIADGEAGRAAIARAFNRGAAATSAQLVGLGRALIDLTVEYAQGRIQFGQPIGAFQAVKHHIANALTKLEFSRPPAYHAAYSISQQLPTVDVDVSTAKALASQAAHGCWRTALQCHGAIAYTYEYHAHMWMKRVLVLRSAWGDPAWHRRRAAETLLASGG